MVGFAVALVPFHMDLLTRRATPLQRLVGRSSTSTGLLPTLSLAPLLVRKPGKCTTKMATQPTTALRTWSTSPALRMSATLMLGVQDAVGDPCGGSL